MGVCSPDGEVLVVLGTSVRQTDTNNEDEHKSDQHVDQGESWELQRTGHETTDGVPIK